MVATSSSRLNNTNNDAGYNDAQAGAGHEGAFQNRHCTLIGTVFECEILGPLKSIETASHCSDGFVSAFLGWRTGRRTPERPWTV